ncbi:MAG: hypothetical protein MN733_24860, partial [Nitrososphaera sp.]|nr:hypothetical protein [Nitrososphaera sp.]
MNSKTIYITIAGTGEIFKTMNGGNTWAKIKEAEFGSTANSFVKIDPHSPEHVVVHGREYNGILISDDGGKTWVKTAVGVNEGIEGEGCVKGFAASYYEYHPFVPGVAFCGGAYSLGGGRTEQRLYKTTDHGKSWQDISNGLSLTEEDDARTIGSMAFDPALPNTYYVATSRGLFKSADGGISWSTLRLYPVIQDHYHAYKVLLVSAGQVVVSTELGIYRTSGDPSILVSNNFGTRSFWPVSSVGVIPGTSEIVALYGTPSGFDAVRSSDGGATWDFSPTLRKQLRYLPQSSYPPRHPQLQILENDHMFVVYEETNLLESHRGLFVAWNSTKHSWETSKPIEVEPLWFRVVPGQPSKLVIAGPQKWLVSDDQGFSWGAIFPGK